MKGKFRDLVGGRRSSSFFLNSQQGVTDPKWVPQLGMGAAPSFHPGQPNMR